MTILSLSSIPPSPRPKSKAAQLAELLPEIEAALQAGHSHHAIYEHVKKTVGLDLTFGYYENTMHRIRRRIKMNVKENPTQPLALQKTTPKVFSAPRANNVQTLGSSKSKLQQILSEPIDDFFS